MYKIYYFMLLLAFSLFSQSNNILFIHPSGARYKKVEMGIKSDLNNTADLISLVSKNEMEIKNAIATSSPKIVIVSNPEIIRVWKRIQQKYSELSQIPSIILESESGGNNTNDMSNSCIITYETKLVQYIENVTLLTGKRPSDIGVIFSSKSADVVQSYQKEASKLNVNLYEKQVIAADPENSIKTIVKNLTDHYKVDLVLILDDQVTINNQIISTTWVPLLSGLSIPIAVPADYFNEIEPRIGSLAIQPHYSAIGNVVASVINNAEVNEWRISHKSIYTDKCVFFFRNKDGSISKQNQIQNDVIALYHPKRTDPVEQATTQVKTVATSQQTPPSADLALADMVETEQVVAQKIPISESETKNAIIEKRFVSVVHNENKNRNEKKSVSQAKATATADKKQEKSSPAEVHASTKQIAQAPELALNRTIEESFDEPIISKHDVDTIDHSQDIDNVNLLQSKNILIIVILLCLIAAILLIYFVLKSRMMYSDAGRNKCLLITKRSKRIKFSEMNDTSISLVKYLKNYGFNVITSRKLSQISDLLLFNLPEIICIDWQFDTDIQMKVNKILKEQIFTAEYILVFYNVAESTDIKMGYYGDRTFFLNTEFTISELNKILSIVKGRSQAKKQLNNKSNSLLEGKIMQDTLSEIFQMMDVNKKTGCLIVETDHPAGMIFFEDGMITYSITNSQIAEAAVFEILTMKHGRFHFLPDKRPLSRQMQMSVVAMLMEQAKYVDEFEITQSE